MRILIMVFCLPLLLQADEKKADIFANPKAMISVEAANWTVDGVAVGDARSTIDPSRIKEKTVLRGKVRTLYHKNDKLYYEITDGRVTRIVIYNVAKELGIKRASEIENVFGEADSSRTEDEGVYFRYNKKNLTVEWFGSSVIILWGAE